ncbi:VWA domain-containing protein [Alphaproteobacteria bacterium]|nr:VWA domain-containing protein [Alphaproteobacteria bacterium]
MPITLNLKPQRNAILREFNNEFYGLLELTHASDNEQNNTKKSLNLSIVLDKSGSMSGEPLYEAKQAAIMMVNKMRSTDQISIVAYDHSAQLIVPSTSCENKNEIINAIQNIYEGGMTNLHNGWLMGAEQVALKKDIKSINRVLLLSDGNANEGIIDLGELKNHCSRLAETSITTSTYGLGSQFNEELMISMAGAGLGHSYYGQTSNDLMDPFNEEFETLLNTVASELQVVSEHPNFVKLELMNNYNIMENNSNLLKFKMPDLAENGEAWALFKIKINQENIQNERLEVLRCNLSYKNVNGEVVRKGPVKIVLDPVSQNAFSQIAEDEKVRLRITEINVARFQERAREAARSGDWALTDFFINEARREAKGNEWLNSVIDRLEVYAKQRQRENFSKEALYSSDKMNKRLVSNDELNMNYSTDLESSKNAYLRRKVERGKRFQ